jgi:hypothetical protein
VARLRLADEVNVARRDSMPLHRARCAMKRSFAMRWRPLGSGGAGPSAVLPRLDDGKPSPSSRRLPAGPAALRTPLSLPPLRGTGMLSWAPTRRTGGGGSFTEGSPAIREADGRALRKDGFPERASEKFLRAMSIRRTLVRR